MKTALYIFMFFITVDSIILNRLFKYNSNNTTIGISKEHIVSYENQGKTSNSKNKPLLISEIIRTMIYLL
jgi:hypothetical protein